ncbi:MAG: hypothetical protein DIU70_003670 [Bacillota bacterium]|nr:MAG: hypothetical protein DIU70_00790 [Bacillota bacterium]
MAYIEEVKNAEVTLIFGPFAVAEKVPGVTAFQHTPEHQVQRRGASNFGGRGPVAITSDYQGESGSITIEGIEGDRMLAAILSGEDPAQFVVEDPRRRFPIYIISNSYDDDGVTPLVGHYVHYCKFENQPRPVGPDARSYNFQGLWSKVFHGKKVVYEVFDGAATPVTALNLSQTAFQDPEDQTVALAVLRQTQNTKSVKVLKKGTDYTETESTITLTQGLAENERALVIYVV